MIRLRPRPPVPPPLESDEVMAKKRAIRQRAESGEKIKSKDFSSYWGNEYEFFLLNSRSFHELALRDLPDLLLEKIRPLEGESFTEKKKFVQAVEALAGREKIQKNEKSLIVECATKTLPKILWEHHDGKCCFCEKKIFYKREADVEHFRPKSEVTEDAGHTGYWWLAYEWDNYLLACKICNSDYKGNHFPILAQGKRAYSEEADLSEEKPVLIHPIDENPEEFIEYEWESANGHLVKAVGVDANGRGDQTANALTGINDFHIMEERANLLPILDAISELLEMSITKNNVQLTDKYSKMLKIKTAASSAFAGFQRAYFRKKGFGGLIS